MAADDNFLSRWSRRKIEARREPAQESAPAAAPPPAQPPAAASAPEEKAAPAGPAPLPPVESLTPESDFTPFMGKDVDAGTRSRALKALFADPHFNAMDMMDVYVDDYSKPDPLPPGWLEKLQQVSHLGDKAGRDREEAERRRALEEAKAREAEATDAPVPAATPEPAAGPVLPEPAPDDAAIPAPVDPIPPRV